jgi:hypothetical protein
VSSREYGGPQVGTDRFVWRELPSVAADLPVGEKPGFRPAPTALCKPYGAAGVVMVMVLLQAEAPTLLVARTRYW